MDKIILITLLTVTNLFWYMLADSYAKDTAGYNYAIDYITTHPDELQDGMLIYCLDGMAEALKKGFLQQEPPKLIKDFK